MTIKFVFFPNKPKNKQQNSNTMHHKFIQIKLAFNSKKKKIETHNIFISNPNLQLDLSSNPKGKAVQKIKKSHILYHQ